MDQTKVDEYLKYECDKGYEWENETAQRAQCLSDNIWALEFSDLLGCQPGKAQILFLQVTTVCNH